MKNRRDVLKSFAAATAALHLPSIAGAQNAAWPTRPVKLLASSATGSATDIISRLIADGLTRRLGQSVVVEARPGAAGQIAAAEVARTGADGYTFVSIFGSYAANVTLAPARTYKESDLAGVSIYGVYPGLTAAHPSIPNTLAGIVEYARANPGAITYASGGTGTLSHIKMEMLANAAGIKLTHVPYKGGAAAVTDLVAGRVQLMGETISLIKPLVERGQLNAIGVDSAKRHPAVPNVPTFVEQGYPDQINDSWMGMVANSAAPKHILKRMSDEVNAVLQTDSVKQLLTSEKFGMELQNFSPEQTDAFIAKEVKKWGDVIRKLNLAA